MLHLPSWGLGPGILVASRALLAGVPVGPFDILIICPFYVLVKYLLGLFTVFLMLYFAASEVFGRPESKKGGTTMATGVIAMGAARKDLRSLRRDAVLTQQELADRIGVQQRMVSKWENGETMPRPTNIRKLAEALEVEPREVLAALQQPTMREN
jgi:DNA-binding transcriptional regulator YiaG